MSQKKQKEYDKTDTVGKAGIEKTMDTTLKGKKGTVKLYVNNVGKVLDTVQGKRRQKQETTFILQLMRICRLQLIIFWNRNLPELY